MLRWQLNDGVSTFEDSLIEALVIPLKMVANVGIELRIGQC